LRPPSGKEYSEKVASEIDDEIRSVLQLGHDRARAILHARKGLLDRVVARLLEKEVIDGQEFAHMVKENCEASKKEGDAGWAVTSRCPGTLSVAGG
jgi:cell division protease FtsH